MPTKEKISQEELDARWAKKREQVELLANSIRSFRNNVTRDLQSKDEKIFLTALAVDMMDKTAERVGNEASAKNGHFGITGLKKSHVSVSGNKITLTYTGKSGVAHIKSFSDARLAKNLRKAIRISPNKYLFCTSDRFRIKADRVNRFLSDFDISAKSIRGFSANRLLVDQLKKGEPYETEKERQRYFNTSAKIVAKKIGHGVATLKKHYLLPELEPEYVKNNCIMVMTDATKYADGGKVKGAVDKLTTEQEKWNTSLLIWGNNPEKFKLGGLFHGSDKKFDTFSTQHIGQSGDSLGGWGIYLSTSRDVASQYLLSSGALLNVTVYENGDWFNLDEQIPDDLADSIVKKLKSKSVSEDDIEQFEKDFLARGDDGYEVATGKQVYDYLSAILDSEKNASMFLLSIGIIGNKFHDKAHPEETNYVVFDADAIKIESDEEFEDGGMISAEEYAAHTILSATNPKRIAEAKKILYANTTVNSNGGLDYKNDAEKIAKEAQIITLPKNIKGTNCGNCVFRRNNFCDHKDLILSVTDRMCCAYWSDKSPLSYVENVFKADFAAYTPETNAVLNERGGYDYSGEELKKAEKADLVTLPENIIGTNCANCKFWDGLEKKEGYCNHPKIKLPVNERMSCGWWDNADALRQWGGATEITFYEKGGFIDTLYKVKTFTTDEGKFSIYDTEKSGARGRVDMFTVKEDNGGWIIRNAFVPDNLQRQGIATSFYKMMNNESLKKTKKPLRSTQPRVLSSGETVHELSKDGIAFWDSLVEKGYADKIGDKNYKFKIANFEQGGNLDIRFADSVFAKGGYLGSCIDVGEGKKEVCNYFPDATVMAEYVGNPDEGDWGKSSQITEDEFYKYVQQLDVPKKVLKGKHSFHYISKDRIGKGIAIDEAAIFFVYNIDADVHYFFRKNKFKKNKFKKGGKIKAKGDCFVVAAEMLMDDWWKGKKNSIFIGTPYVVHAEVSGRGKLSGVRFAHAWVEDDEFVYDNSNGLDIKMEKELYYVFGEVNANNPNKYRKYSYQELSKKMVETGRYGYWDLDCKFENGGVFKSGGNIWDRGERPSPKESATLYPVGHRMRGQDGNVYIVSADSRGVQRWKKTYGATTQQEPAKEAEKITIEKAIKYMDALLKETEKKEVKEVKVVDKKQLINQIKNDINSFRPDGQDGDVSSSEKMVTSEFRDLGNWIHDEENHGGGDEDDDEDWREDDDNEIWASGEYKKYSDKFQEWAKKYSWYDSVKLAVTTSEKNWCEFNIQLKDLPKYQYGGDVMDVTDFMPFTEENINDELKGIDLVNIAEKHHVGLGVIDKQYLKGIQVEREHTENMLIASEIVKDHLFEMPDYYTKLAEMEGEKFADGGELSALSQNSVVVWITNRHSPYGVDRVVASYIKHGRTEDFQRDCEIVWDNPNYDTNDKFLNGLDEFIAQGQDKIQGIKDELKRWVEKGGESMKKLSYYGQQQERITGWKYLIETAQTIKNLFADEDEQPEQGITIEKAQEYLNVLLASVSINKKHAEVSTDLQTIIDEVSQTPDKNSAKIGGSYMRTKWGDLYGEKGAIVYGMKNKPLESLFSETKDTVEEMNDEINGIVKDKKKFQDKKWLESNDFTEKEAEAEIKNMDDDIANLKKEIRHEELVLQQKSLEDAGYIESDTNEDGWIMSDTYILTELGREFINAVDARLETRKRVARGEDLFPSEANIPEFVFKNGGSVTDKYEQEAQRRYEAYKIGVITGEEPLSFEDFKEEFLNDGEHDEYKDGGSVVDSKKVKEILSKIGFKEGVDYFKEGKDHWGNGRPDAYGFYDSALEKRYKKKKEDVDLTGLLEKELDKAGIEPINIWVGSGVHGWTHRLKQALAIALSEESRSVFAQGGVVTFVPETDRYKKEWGRKGNRDDMECIGSFDIKQWKNSVGFLYELNAFDKAYYAHVLLKTNEMLFRYETDQTKISGMMPVIKINIEKGLLYFLKDLYADDDKNIVFDTVGVKALYLSLHESVYRNLAKQPNYVMKDKFEDGGKVEDKKEYVVKYDDGKARVFTDKQVARDFAKRRLGELFIDGVREMDTFADGGQITKGKDGECYKNVQDYLMENWLPDAVIVHGEVTTSDGITKKHAWIVDGDKVFDATTGVAADKGKYYSMLKAKEDNRYELPEALKLRFATKNYGAWTDAERVRVLKFEKGKFGTGGSVGIKEVVFTKKVNPAVKIIVKKYSDGRIQSVESPKGVLLGFGARFPFSVGQIMQRNVENWACVNGWLMDGKDMCGEEKIFGVKVSDVPQGHEWRMIYPHKFRKHEKGGAMYDYLKSKAEHPDYMKDSDLSSSDTVIGEFTVKTPFHFHGDMTKVGDKFKLTLAKVQDYSTIDNLKKKNPVGWVKLHSNDEFDFWIIYEINELNKFGVVDINYVRMDKMEDGGNVGEWIKESELYDKMRELVKDIKHDRTREYTNVIKPMGWYANKYPAKTEIETVYNVQYLLKNKVVAAIGYRYNSNKGYKIEEFVDENNVTKMDKFKDGGLLVGKSHADGGMPMIVEGSGQNVEVEGKEFVVCDKAFREDTVLEMEGTRAEIAYELNRMYKCNTGTADSLKVGQYILCKKAMADDEVLNLKGTAKEIITQVAETVNCNGFYEDGGALMAQGGYVSQVRHSIHDIAKMHKVSDEHIKDQFIVGAKNETEENPLKKQDIIKRNLISNPYYYNKAKVTAIVKSEYVDAIKEKCLFGVAYLEMAVSDNSTMFEFAKEKDAIMVKSCIQDIIDHKNKSVKIEPENNEPEPENKFGELALMYLREFSFGL